MATSGQTHFRRYLIHFANEHLDFRIAELESILKVFRLDVTLPDNDITNPFMVLELPSGECAQKIASRAILVRSVYELWAYGTTYSVLNEALGGLPKSFTEPHFKCREPYRFHVTTFNKSIPNKEKIKKIETLDWDILKFEGKVDLKNAKHIYHIVEYYGAYPQPPSDEPQQIYFAKWIADGQRDKINEFHLQKRHFIANTSMDAGLSMIMANIGKVKPNMLVFDPFVGSGSLLVAAAAHGAYVLGTDIDYLLLHAKARPSRCNEKKRGADESIRANLRQYGLEHLYVDALVADTSRSAMWRQTTLFDTIITDPPYGIREGAKKVGTETADVFIDEDLKASGNHYPKRLDYHLSDIFRDLLNFSAKYLHRNGRLVYWFPVSVQTYTEENIPTHPCLKMVHNCEQKLNTRLSRRLITMEKVRDYSEGIQNAAVKVDHFQESTFREMYFNDSNLQKERTPDASKIQKKVEDLNVNDT